MITPLLEKMLLSGKAKYKTFTSHCTAVSKIIVPKGEYIIITDITINPFTDLDTRSPLTDADIDVRSTHVLDIFAGNDRNPFIFRNNYEQQPALNGGLGEIYLINSEPVHFDTFLVCNEDAYVTIITKETMLGTASSVFKVLQNTLLPRPPQSYGDQVEVLTEYNENSGFRYIPTSINEAGTTIPVGGGSSNQPVYTMNVAQALQDPFVIRRNWGASLYNIGYVSINEINLKNLVG